MAKYTVYVHALSVGHPLQRTARLYNAIVCTFYRASAPKSSSADTRMEPQIDRCSQNLAEYIPLDETTLMNFIRNFELYGERR